MVSDVRDIYIQMLSEKKWVDLTSINYKYGMINSKVRRAPRDKLYIRARKYLERLINE